MFIVQIIIFILVIVAAIEGMILHILIQEYRKQFLKTELLTKIIEERFSKYGENFDKR